MSRTDEHYHEEMSEDEVWKRQRQEEDQYYQEMIEEMEQIDKREKDLEDDLFDRTLKDDDGNKPKTYDKPAKLNI